jgi:two-component system, NarL family, nitrate/nitrite response regulator NarL
MRAPLVPTAPEHPGSGNALRNRAGDAGHVRLRCLIIDDSPQLLEAARALLELDGISVVGVASTTAEAVQRVQDLKPDVALVDVELGTESGLDLAHRLRRETSLAPSRVILISAHAHQDMIDLVTAAPAAAFLSKSHLSARAIRDILGDIDA